jgi:hypothetical protein
MPPDWTNFDLVFKYPPARKDLLSIEFGRVEPDKYFFKVVVEDKPVLIRIGDKEYIGTREDLYKLMKGRLIDAGFSEMIIPKVNRNE